ncbi:leucine rich adaptor protein 1 [Platysternon megacephalum]|uniref:Leucine rich adaptor protein 1 n=1 Tax=Platysternon megacephalum TaxID=55544 RepID=A0A4D9E3E2_9SAUR|nr:leucine rich adaptor protein 1 [Platysternon megacephalum]
MWRFQAAGGGGGRQEKGFIKDFAYARSLTTAVLYLLPQNYSEHTLMWTHTQADMDGKQQLIESQMSAACYHYIGGGCQERYNLSMTYTYLSSPLPATSSVAHIAPSLTGPRGSSPCVGLLGRPFGK